MTIDPNWDQIESTIPSNRSRSSLVGCFPYLLSSFAPLLKTFDFRHTATMDANFVPAIYLRLSILHGYTRCSFSKDEKTEVKCEWAAGMPLFPFLPFFHLILFSRVLFQCTQHTVKAMCAYTFYIKQIYTYRR